MAVGEPAEKLVCMGRGEAGEKACGLFFSLGSPLLFALCYCDKFFLIVAHLLNVCLFAGGKYAGLRVARQKWLDSRMSDWESCLWCAGSAQLLEKAFFMLTLCSHY